MTANSNSNSGSRFRILLFWLMLVAIIIGWPILLILRSSHRPSPVDNPGLGHAIIMFVLGAMALAAGVAGYLGAVFTQCLTFDFSRPVWNDIKVKQFFANLYFVSLFAIGVGFMSSAFLAPLMTQFNLPGQTAFMVPFFVGVIGMQIFFICILVWAPLEKRIIQKRLAALGITADQMRGGLYIGLSNPAVTSTAKRFAAIEEDMGMLWLTPGQMIFWGDVEQFAIAARDIIQVERKVDAKSNTMLSGTAHVILHVRLANNEERLIRLHTEGVRTIVGKRQASNELAVRINTWLGSGIVPPV